MMTTNQMRQPQKSIGAEQQILSLGRVLQNLREEDNIDVLIKTTISYLQEQFDYKLIWIALYDQLNHILFGKGGITPDINKSFLTRRVVLSSGGLLEQAVIGKRPLGVADLQAEIRVGEWQQLAEKCKIQGTIILPVCYKDRCLGLVLLGSERWGYLLGGEDKARLLIVLSELGAVLYQHEIARHHKQIKHADELLLQLLENLRTLTNLDQKLKAVVEASQQFVSPTRTNIYWFEREKRYFWLRASNKRTNVSSNQQQLASGIKVQEVNDFYYALAANQIVLIGEGQTSFKSNFTGKLLQSLRVRSLLAAPIIWQKDLLGFLAVEGNEPRIWTEADENFVKGAAGLISLVTPLESMETTIRQIQADAQLTSQVAKSFYSDDDLQEILRNYGTQLLARLNATRLLLLQYDETQKKYQIFYQIQPNNRRPLISTLNAPKEVDWELLQYSIEAVGIENLEEDLRFFNWRSSLQETGVRSLLICNCTLGHAPEVVLVIAHEVTRSWTTLEKELLQVISQQIGVIVRQWQLQVSMEQQQKILQSFQQSLRILEQAHSAKIQTGETHLLQQLEHKTLEEIASVLGCPLAVLLSWTPGKKFVEIIPGVMNNSRFAISSDAVISVQTDALIQQALATDELLIVKVDDLSLETKQWLNGSGIGQIVVIALRITADYEPTGVVLIADHPERQWSKQSLSATKSLVQQLAWFRRCLQITQIFQSRAEELQQLNWYKHRRLEEIQRTTVLLLTQMHDLDIPKDEITYMRYQQILRQLDHTTTSMNGLVNSEQWQLDNNVETISIASLLKRSLERVENLVKKQKLWVSVHDLVQPVQDEQLQKGFSPLHQSSLGLKRQTVTISGDISKIELILYELLLTACQRSQTGGRIDIWCSRLDEQYLEVFITDNGTIEPQLLAELNQDIPKDMLAPSTLDQPPGLHLLICQKLIQKLGGELNFYQLPDSRLVSRLLLPLA